MRRSCLWEFLFWTFYSLHSTFGWVFSLYFLQSPTFSLCWKHWFPRAAITNHHKVGKLKQPKFVFSQFRRAEVWNQCIRGLMLLLKALEKNSFLPFPSFGGFPTFSLPWLEYTLQSLPLFPWGLIICVSACLPFL